MYGLTISFTYFEVFFLKIPTVKNFSPAGLLLSPYGGSITLMYTNIMHDLTIAIINKCFEFENNWFKIICIR